MNIALYLGKGQWVIDERGASRYVFGSENDQLYLIEENKEEIRMELRNAVNSSNLKEEWKERFTEMLLSFEDMFSKEPKITPVLKHHIELKEKKHLSILKHGLCHRMIVK